MQFNAYFHVLQMLFCLQNFRGDEKVKAFSWDLIAPAENGQSGGGGGKDRNNGSSTPATPRSRKSKKSKDKEGGKAALPPAMYEGAEWTRDEKYDPEINLDSGYRRHVSRHCNKVVLRIRMLYYIKQEIIGQLDAQVINREKVLFV